MYKPNKHRLIAFVVIIYPAFNERNISSNLYKHMEKTA